jgi:hypothetical protein
MPNEIGIISRIIALADPGDVGFLSALSDLTVQEMSDGGMGSLYIEHPTKNKEDRRFGRRLGELLYKDSDGVDVLISLNLDKEGNLYELDVWKTDFSPTINLEIKPS